MAGAAHCKPMRRGGAGKERRHESASELKARQRLQHLENELRRPAPGVVDDEGSASEAEVAPNRRLGPAEVEEMGSDGGVSDADSDADSSAHSDEDSDEDSDVDAERARRELAEVPFGVLQELQKDGTHKQEREVAKNREANLVGRAAHKGAPVEMGSKKPVSRFRVVVPLAKRKGCDPRFEALSGQFNQDMFDKAYAFVGEKREDEIKKLKDQMKKLKNKEKRDLLQDELKELQRVQQAEAAAKDNRARLQERRRDERSAVEHGKKPFFLKKSDERVLNLARRYQELQSKSPRKIDDIASKKRKKNAQKDHRYVPYARRNGTA